ERMHYLDENGGRAIFYFTLDFKDRNSPANFVIVDSEHGSQEIDDERLPVNCRDNLGSAGRGIISNRNEQLSLERSGYVSSDVHGAEIIDILACERPLELEIRLLVLEKPRPKICSLSADHKCIGV